MTQPITTINFLPSWHEAEARDAAAAAAIRTCDEDGTHHYSHIKRIGDSGVQYLHAVNVAHEPTPAMLLGTAVHAIVLGERPGKPVLVYPGKARSGKAWEAFEAEHAGAEIVTAAEWSKAEEIAASVKSSPVARAYLDGARFEVPLAWDEDGLKCNTSGVDILPPGLLGDLKTTATTELDALMRQCFRFSYHCQLAFYRRGARANGIDVSKGLFLLCVETRAPFEVVALELSEDLIDLGDRTVALWLERLRVYTDSRQFPGRAQSPVVWTVPSWMQNDEDGDDA